MGILLMVGLLILLIITFEMNNHSFFSVAFFSIGFFIISSFFYLLGEASYYNTIRPNTVILILGSLIFLAVGERFGIKTIISIKRKKQKKYLDVGVYQINKGYIVSITTIMIITFIYRFYDLVLYSKEHNGAKGFWGTISSVRLDFAMGEYTPILPLYSLFILLTLISEIQAYFFIYIFLNNLSIEKRPTYNFLLPVVGYCIILLSLTERTGYIKLVSCIFVSVIVSFYKSGGYEKQKETNDKIFKILLKIGIIFTVLFFVYGFLRQRKMFSSNLLLNYMIGYLGAPIIGLDKVVNNAIQYKKDIFGYYTLYGGYNVLNQLGAGIETHETHLPMFEYAPKLSSNIYSSLMFPYVDYGVVGTFLTRSIIGYINGWFQRIVFFAKGSKSSTILKIIITSLLFYCGIMNFCADRYAEIFLSPSTLIKYTMFAYFVIKFLIPYKFLRRAS